MLFMLGLRLEVKRACVLGWGLPCLLLTDFTPSPLPGLVSIVGWPFFFFFFLICCYVSEFSH